MPLHLHRPAFSVVQFHRNIFRPSIRYRDASVEQSALASDIRSHFQSQASVETPQSEEDLRCTKADASRSSLDGRVSKGPPLLIPGEIQSGEVISSYEAAEK